MVGVWVVQQRHTPVRPDSFCFAKLCFFVMVLVQGPRCSARSLSSFDQRLGKGCACPACASVFFMPRRAEQSMSSSLVNKKWGRTIKANYRRGQCWFTPSKCLEQTAVLPLLIAALLSRHLLPLCQRPASRPPPGRAAVLGCTFPRASCPPGWDTRSHAPSRGKISLHGSWACFQTFRCLRGLHLSGNPEQGLLARLGSGPQPWKPRSQLGVGG